MEKSKATKILQNTGNKLNYICDTGKLGKLTQAESYQAIDAYNGLIYKIPQETISAGVADFFRKQGFDVKVKGIGWEISC